MFLINKFRLYFIFLNCQAYFSLRNSTHASTNNSCKKYFDERKQIKSTTATYSKLHMFGPNQNLFFPHVYTPTVEVKDKINDIKAKSKDIVTQKLIEVLNSFSFSSSARQPSLNMRFYRLCDLTGLHCKCNVNVNVAIERTNIHVLFTQLFFVCVCYCSVFKSKMI